jgi:hypothetical protein
MPEVLTFAASMQGALAFMAAGWLAFVPIWVISKFALM